MVYIGIDPGASGGYAVIHDDGEEAYPLPDKRRTLLVAIENLDLFKERRICLEKVGGYIQGSKGNIGSAMFNFGVGYGQILMAITAACLDDDTEEVHPRTWQTIVPKKYRGSKARMRYYAESLYPKVRLTDKTADALLIAEYCRRKHEGEL